MSNLGLAVLLGAIVLVIAAGALFVAPLPGADGGSATAVESVPPPDPPADGSSGVVVGVHKAKNGFEIFGLTLHSPSYAAHVMLVPPAECVVSDDGHPTKVIGDGACSGLAATGPVSGGGQTASGLELVIVEVEISKQCHDALHAGDTWPPDLSACTQD